jgi:hypothetical protein
MQGNCSSPHGLGFSELGLISFKPGQCILETNVAFLHATHSLWLDHVYIRQKSTSGNNTYAHLSFYSRGCKIWLTSVTVQGDLSQYPHYGGVYLQNGQLYAEGAAAVGSLHMK